MKYVFVDIDIKDAVEKSVNFDGVLRVLNYPKSGSLKNRVVRYIRDNNISTSHFIRRAWNKGYYLSPEYRKKISSALKGRSTGRAGSPEKEIARRRKISDSMKKNPKCGGLREGSGRGKKVWYESEIAGRVYLRSTYELEYARWLDKNSIKWKQNLIKFPYLYNEKTHYYYPDFYLYDNDEYVEVKGFTTEKDLAKWKEFPYKLRILMRSDLKLLGCNII